MNHSSVTITTLEQEFYNALSLYTLQVKTISETAEQGNVALVEFAMALTQYHETNDPNDTNAVHTAHQNAKQVIEDYKEQWDTFQTLFNELKKKKEEIFNLFPLPEHYQQLWNLTEEGYHELRTNYQGINESFNFFQQEQYFF
jgi:hypothetical protein